MKKSISSILLTLFLVTNIPNVTYAKNKQNKLPVPEARSAVLMDADSGEILYSKNKDKAYPPASTTKILTTLLTLEKGNLDDVITVGKKPPYAEGSSISLRIGEKAKVIDILYGLNLQSGNDCAEALAEYISGTQKKFVKLMNKRAKELGCTDSNFVNPSGLYNKNHIASAKDLALIYRELIKHPEYFEIATTLTHKMSKNNKCKVTRYIWNKNRMVRHGTAFYYKYAVGGKLGYTVQSHHSYVAVAKKGGRTLIVTLVNSKSTFGYYGDAKNLFEYGFKNYSTKELFKKDDKLSDIKIGNSVKLTALAGDNFYYSIKKSSNNTSPNYTLNYDKKSLAGKTINSGDKIGTIVVKDGSNKTIIPLLSGSSYKPPKNPAPGNVVKSHKNVLGFSLGLILLAALVLFYRFRIRRNRRRYNGYTDYSNYR